MWTPTASPIDRQLRPGEKLLWSGQPRRGIRLRGMDAFLIPFSLLWCGFAVLWETIAVVGHAPSFVLAFGFFFVLVGLYIVFGRFVVDAKARARTFYGVTNERIIIVNGLFAIRTTSLKLRTLHDISLTERRDGSGTITFGPTYPVMWWAATRSWPGGGAYAMPAFDMIEQVREVYDLIEQAQRTT